MPRILILTLSVLLTACVGPAPPPPPFYAVRVVDAGAVEFRVPPGDLHLLNRLEQDEVMIGSSRDRQDERPVFLEPKGVRLEIDRRAAEEGARVRLSNHGAVPVETERLETLAAELANSMRGDRSSP